MQLLYLTEYILTYFFSTRIYRYFILNIYAQTWFDLQSLGTSTWILKDFVVVKYKDPKTWDWDSGVVGASVWTMYWPSKSCEWPMSHEYISKCVLAKVDQMYVVPIQTAAVMAPRLSSRFLCRSGALKSYVRCLNNKMLSRHPTPRKIDHR